MSSVLEKDFDYYISHQKEFVRKYNGRYLVIRDDQITGHYATEKEAYCESIKKFPLGSFLIQKCTPGEDSYTMTLYSDVDFNA